jgi:hypothetical protein
VAGGLVAFLVLILWYPPPFHQVSGGLGLLALIVGVDIVLGPLLTLIVAAPTKSSDQLKLDVSKIVLIQFAGLAYGLYTMEQARPVALALEIDRLRVVRSYEVSGSDLAMGPKEFHTKPLWGVFYVATRSIAAEERFDAVMSGLSGKDIGATPSFWLPQAQTRVAWSQAALNVELLQRQFPTQKEKIQTALRDTGLAAADVGYLPILGREDNYIAWIDRRSGVVAGFARFE